jgi:hypothetical protein
MSKFYRTPWRCIYTSLTCAIIYFHYITHTTHKPSERNSVVFAPLKHTVDLQAGPDCIPEYKYVNKRDGGGSFLEGLYARIDSFVAYWPGCGGCDNERHRWSGAAGSLSSSYICSGDANRYGYG